FDLFLFKTLSQLRQHLSDLVALQPLLLSSPPLLRPGRDRLSGLRQILTHMIEIDQITALPTKALLDLADDPPRSVAQTMNPTRLARAGPLCTRQQLCASHLDGLQRGLILFSQRPGLVGQTQARLLPIQLSAFSAVFWAFFSNFNDGNHTAVGLGDHLRDTALG